MCWPTGAWYGEDRRLRIVFYGFAIALTLLSVLCFWLWLGDPRAGHLPAALSVAMLPVVYLCTWLAAGRCRDVHGVRRSGEDRISHAGRGWRMIVFVGWGLLFGLNAVNGFVVGAAASFGALGASLLISLVLLWFGLRPLWRKPAPGPRLGVMAAPQPAPRAQPIPPEPDSLETGATPGPGPESLVLFALVCVAVLLLLGLSGQLLGLGTPPWLVVVAAGISAYLTGLAFSRRNLRLLSRVESNRLAVRCALAGVLIHGVSGNVQLGWPLPHEVLDSLVVPALALTLAVAGMLELSQRRAPRVIRNRRARLANG